MNITEKMDLAIKLAQTGTTDGGYTIENIKRSTYMSNKEWGSFLLTMDPGARAEYTSTKKTVFDGLFSLSEAT